MLPFMKPKQQVGVIVKNRTPDAPVGDDTDNSSSANEGLEAAATDLIRAVHSKDIKQVADALRAAFEICDSEPHEEGPHLNDESEES